MSTCHCKSALTVGLIWTIVDCGFSFFPLWQNSFLLDGIYICMCSSFHRIGMKRNIQRMVSLWPKPSKTVPQKNFSRGDQLLLFFKVKQRRTLHIWYFHLFIHLLCNIGWIAASVLFYRFAFCYCFFWLFFFRKNGKPKQRLLVSLDSKVPFYTKYYYFFVSVSDFCGNIPSHFIYMELDQACCLNVTIKSTTDWLPVYAQ